jgi:hypothetical protein
MQWVERDAPEAFDERVARDQIARLKAELGAERLADGRRRMWELALNSENARKLL